MTSAPYVLAVAETPAQREAAARLEAHVFGRWFGNTVEQLREEYDAFAARTFFLTVTDRGNGAPVGTLRVITGGPTNKTVADCASAPWDASPEHLVAGAGLELASTWDVATVAVDPTLVSGPARGEIALALYHGLTATALAGAVTSMTAMLDDRVLDRLRGFGMPFRPLPGLTGAPYLGSPCTTPVHMRHDEARAGVAGHPLVGAPVIHGRGFTEVEVPPAGHWLGHPAIPSTSRGVPVGR